MIRIIYREIMRGKTLWRTLLNLRLASIRIAGQGMDLGAPTIECSYYQFLKHKGARITFADLHPTHPDVLKVDLEQPFPIASDSQDFLLLFNVMEHMYNHRSCIAECCRVLKPGAQFIGATPFLYYVHPSPEDFWRFTDAALSRLLYDNGFTSVRVEALGFGALAAAASQVARIVPIRFIRAAIILAAITLDRLIVRARPSVAFSAQTWPLGYVFVATK